MTNRLITAQRLRVLSLIEPLQLTPEQKREWHRVINEIERGEADVDTLLEESRRLHKNAVVCAMVTICVWSAAIVASMCGWL